MLCRPDIVRDQGLCKKSQLLSMAVQASGALLSTGRCSGHRGDAGHRKPRGSPSSLPPDWAVMNKRKEGLLGSKDSSAQPWEQNKLKKHSLCKTRVAKDLTELKHTGAEKGTRRGYKLCCTENEPIRVRVASKRQEKEAFLGVSK